MNSKLLTLILSVFLIHCQSSEKTADGSTHLSASGKNILEAESQQITVKGINKNARFSPNDKNIIFVSKNRKLHKNTQIYELNIETRKERRISFQDGEVKNPDYTPDGLSFIYASTTDEVKENPLFIKNRLRRLEARKKSIDMISPPFLTGSELLPFEIYKSQSDGESIDRLTHTPYLDHEPTQHPFKPFIIFSSVRAGGLELFKLDTSRNKITQLTKNHMFNDEARFSREGKKIAWIRYNPKKEESHIFTGSIWAKNRKQITKKPAYHWSPDWHPSGEWLIFSANIDDKKNYELYMMSVKGNCLKRLTYNSSFDGYPSINKKGDRLIFTSERTGQPQIHMMKIKEPQPCLADNS